MCDDMCNTAEHGFDGGDCCEGTCASTFGAETTADFVPYFSYTGALAVSGSVSVAEPGVWTQSFAYDLSGVDPECALGPGTAANSCGMHLHTGSTCDADAGGHYFTGTVTADPWTTISYTPTVTGTVTATGVVTVTTGGTGEDMMGRAVVVHGYDGGRIACALLADYRVRSVPWDPVGAGAAGYGAFGYSCGEDGFDCQDTDRRLQDSDSSSDTYASGCNAFQRDNFKIFGRDSLGSELLKCCAMEEFPAYGYYYYDRFSNNDYFDRGEVGGGATTHTNFPTAFPTPGPAPP